MAPIGAAIAGLSTFAVFIALASGASAQATTMTTAPFGADEIVLLAALVGTLTFAVICAIALIRARSRTDAENVLLRQQVAALRASADRAESLLDVDDRRLVVWEVRNAPPEVIGDLPATAGAPSDRSQFIAFGKWMVGKSAAELDRALERLRERGESFTAALKTQAGTYVEATGRTVGGRAVVRFRDLTGDRLALATLETQHRAATAQLAALKAALDVIPLPAWVRDRDGRLVWVNTAYVTAVEAADRESALVSEVEFLDTPARDAIAATHAKDALFHRRLSIVSRGERNLFDIADVTLDSGSAGMAVDVTAVESSQSAMQRLVDFHARTLDQLATAVAIFGPDRRLRSSNAAYRALFGLDAAFLESMPDEGAILDRLRATRKLPEQADFRGWKADLLSAYRSLEAREHLWHLPEGQTLRVIANPQPQGGMIWIYENVTERLDLESRYKVLIRVQGETLDHLREGVAVFGSDGRLKLSNPAFASIWRLNFSRLPERPHINDVVVQCRTLHNDTEAWERLTACVAGFDETRASISGRMERKDGRTIDYATVPLPEGQTMVTFVDITDSVMVERALIDRNDALEAADRLKNDFIQHVSYELRSPLTNIIGFTQLLGDDKVGPLNGKQREYLGYIMTSSGSLLAIVNDILDLATIDAGIMTLDLTEIDLAATIDASVQGIRDRLVESNLRLETRIQREIGVVVADEKRLRQILYNLLSNAVSFSNNGGKIVVSARRDGDQVVLEVEDDGPGIPKDFLDLVFERFESRGVQGAAARGGAGLGLAIVKSFAELHGGSVSIKSEPGKGTLVRVALPRRPNVIEAAAE